MLTAQAITGTDVDLSKAVICGIQLQAVHDTWSKWLSSLKNIMDVDWLLYTMEIHKVYQISNISYTQKVRNNAEQSKRVHKCLGDHLANLSSHRKSMIWYDSIMCITETHSSIVFTKTTKMKGTYPRHCSYLLARYLTWTKKYTCAYTFG